MRTEEFDYDLPVDLIAQTPVEPRDVSRFMVVHRKTGLIEHRTFRDIVDYIKPRDCLVINNTRVIPARLKGEKVGTGGKVEIFLLAQVGDNLWETLVKPGRRLQPGSKVSIGEGRITATIEKRLSGGERLVSFECEDDFEKTIEEFGEMPLPPYITRSLRDDERERYQTVYAREKGSVAAPTAGLHFTQDLIMSLKEKGVFFASVTLRVGLDTFRPVREEIVEKHKMHNELYRVGNEASQTVNKTKKAGGRVIAVGTTSVRVLETTGSTGELDPGTGETEIFIYPGYTFAIVDSMITNFHLPKSTLLMMVSAFAGKDLIAKAYREAIHEGYRFYSFGDAMMIL